MVTSLIERNRPENGRHRSGCRQVGRKSGPFWSVLAVAAIALLSSPSWGVAANDDYYVENYDDANYNYAANDDANNNGDDYYNNNANGDDAYYANGDDGNLNGDDNVQNDDDNVQNGDDNVQNDNASNGDDFYSYKSNGDDNFEQGYSAVDDDVFHWSPELGFEGVSVMPISCIN